MFKRKKKLEPDGIDLPEQRPSFISHIWKHYEWPEYAQPSALRMVLEINKLMDSTGLSVEQAYNLLKQVSSGGVIPVEQPMFLRINKVMDSTGLSLEQAHDLLRRLSSGDTAILDEIIDIEFLDMTPRTIELREKYFDALYVKAYSPQCDWVTTKEIMG